MRRRPIARALVAGVATLSLVLGGGYLVARAADAVPELPVVSGNEDPITGNEWTTPQDVNKGQVPVRSTILPYETAEEAKANNTLKKAEDSATETSTVRLLNGTWLFKYVSKPANRPDLSQVQTYEQAEALESEIETDEMPVPASWQTANRYAGAVTPDYPIYNNQDYPWQTADNKDSELLKSGEAASNPSANTSLRDGNSAPSAWNPVGSYFRTVNLSADDLANSRIIISFQGVQQGFYLYVNGQVVGYNEDSFTPSEYDITPYVHEGENLIAAQVFRWTTGGWLENQDMTNFSGIFRDVFMTIQPDVSLYDYALDTTFENGDYTRSTLELAVDVANITDAEANRTVRATVYDANGAQVGEPMTAEVSVPAKSADASQAATATVELSQVFENPELWSAETPNLYTIVFELQQDGKTVNAFARRFGFKEFVMRGQDGSGTSEMTINGKNVEFYGVAAHENSPKGGQYVPYETIVQDIVNAKQMNINSIRTCHYPQSVHMMELCDEYGIYVMDEFNNETHNGRDGVNNDAYKIDPSLSSRDFGGNDSRYTNAFIDRATATVMRDRNNASTALYSLGNEAGTGPNFDTMIDVIKNLDAEKPIHYQGDNGNARVDVKGSMYPDAGKYRSDARQPEIAMEYEHSMGNSGGDLDAYINEMEANWRYQGGFLWDYIDKGAATLIPGKDGSLVSDDPTVYEFDPVNDGENNLLYDGYDSHKSWPQESKDGNLVSNGIINPDRSWQPQAWEVKKQYQGIKFTQSEEQAASGKVTMKNFNRFLDASYYQIDWTLLKNGEATDQSGTLTDEEAALAPADVINADITCSQKELTIPYSIDDPEDGAEYQLLIEYRLKSDTAYAEKGYVQGSAQFELPTRGSDITAGELGSLSLNDGDTTVTLSGTTSDGTPFSVAFDKQSGVMSSYKVGEKDLITSDGGPIGSFFRPEPDSSAAVKGQATLNTPGNISIREAYNDWVDQGKDMQNVRVSAVATSDTTVKVIVEATLQNGSGYSVSYTVYGDGTIRVDSSLEPSADAPSQLGEVGMMLQLPAEFENLQWYGRGPQENYWNRKSGYNIGVWDSTVTDQFYPYNRIQETGNKTDVRWLALTNDEGVGLMASMAYDEGYTGDTLEFVALHYDPKELSTANTNGKLFPWEATRTENVVLRVLNHQKGVASEAWNEDPKNGIISKSDTDLLSYSYMLRPITASSEAADKTAAAQTIYPAAELPQVDSIRIDGMLLEGFSPDTLTYDYSLPVYYPTDKIPEVSAQAGEGVNVTIEQPTAAPSVDEPVVARVNVSQEGSGAQLTYVITISAQPTPPPSVRLVNVATIPSTLGNGGSTDSEICVDNPDTGKLLYAFTGYQSIYTNKNQDGDPIQTGGSEYSNGYAGNALQVMDFDIKEYEAVSFSAVAGMDSAMSSSKSSVKFQLWAYKNVDELTADHYASYAPNKDNGSSVPSEGWTLLAETGTLSGSQDSGDTFKDVSLTYEDENGETRSYEAIRLLADPVGSNGHDQVVWCNPTVLVGNVSDNPEFRSIQLDGATLPGFDKDVTDYKVLIANDAALPEVTADYDNGMFLYLEQAADVPGQAIVKTADATYTISFERAASPEGQQAYLTDYFAMPALDAEGANQSVLLSGNLTYVHADKGALLTEDLPGGYERGFAGVAGHTLDVDVSAQEALRLEATLALADDSAQDASATFAVFGLKDASVLNNAHYAALTGVSEDEGWVKLADVTVGAGEPAALDVDLTYTEDGSTRSYEALRLVSSSSSETAPTVVWGNPLITNRGAQLSDPWLVTMRGSSFDGSSAMFDYLFAPDTQSDFTQFIAAYDENNRMVAYDQSTVEAGSTNEDGSLTASVAEGSSATHAVYAQVAEDGTLLPLIAPYVTDDEGNFVQTPLYQVADAADPAISAVIDAEANTVTITGTGFSPAATLVLRSVCNAEGADSAAPDYVGILTADGSGSFSFTFTSNEDVDASDLIVSVGGQGVAEAVSLELRDGELVEPPTVTGIAVRALPAKTAYLLGEEFDPAGLEVVLTLSDGTSRVLGADEYELSGFDSASPNAHQVITVALTADPSMTTSFEVSVSADKGGLTEGIEDALEAVSGRYTAESWAAFEQALDAAREVLANAAASQADVDAALKALTEAVSGLEERPAEVETTLVRLEIVRLPNKLTYQVGEKLDTTGLEVVAVDSAGMVHEIPANSYVVSGFDSSKVTSGQIVTVSLTADDSLKATFNVSVVEKGGEEPEPEPATEQVMHRLYNRWTGEHFYTASEDERDVLVSVGWTYEGIGWVAPTEGDEVWRLYNPFVAGGDHHYTMSESEYEALEGLGWKQEGRGWYSGGDVKVYRQYNPYAETGTHNYTTDKAENDALVELGWNEEGVGWYALAAK